MSDSQICVSLGKENIRDLELAVSRLPARVEFAELRLDYLQRTEFQRFCSRLVEFISLLPKRVILTLRPIEQGGRAELSLPERSSFWLMQEHKQHSGLMDIEVDLVEYLAQNKRSEIDWNRVICSFHSFDETNIDVLRLYRRLARTPARVLKIALAAKDATDCISIFGILDRAGVEGRELIPICMNSAGLMTRILGASRGAFLTYTSLNTSDVTASGQLTASELRDVYRVPKINRDTQITGLIGKPIEHSLSPVAHNAAFEDAGLDAIYIPFEVADVAAFCRRMVHPATRELSWNLRGLSVTAPHKISVMDHLDWIDDTAREIGSVNTVLVGKNKLVGYNTDAAAIVKCAASRLTIKDSRVAVIGAGGAARAAVWSLKREGARITIFARDPEKVKEFADRFDCRVQSLQMARFGEVDLVMNATPLGSLGALQNLTPACADQLAGARFVFDLVYNPVETLFLREARAAGCKSINGLEMFINQAVAQFELWTGQHPREGVMWEAANRALTRSGESSATGL